MGKERTKRESGEKGMSSICSYIEQGINNVGIYNDINRKYIFSD